MCVCVYLAYSSQSWESGGRSQEAQAEGKVQPLECPQEASSINAASSLKPSWVLPAPLDLHHPWCLKTWLVLSGVLFYSIWGIYLVSWWKGRSNTEDTQWTFFFAYPWDPQLRKDSQNWKHHHNCVEIHNFYTTFASIVSSANIFTHWKSTMIKHLTTY